MLGKDEMILGRLARRVATTCAVGALGCAGLVLGGATPAGAAAAPPTGGGMFSAYPVTATEAGPCPGLTMSSATLQGVLQRGDQNLDMAASEDLSLVPTSCVAGAVSSGTVTGTAFDGGGACAVDAPTDLAADLPAYENCIYRLSAATVGGTYTEAAGGAVELDLTVSLTWCQWGGACTTDPPVTAVVDAVLGPGNPGTAAVGAWRQTS